MLQTRIDKRCDVRITVVDERLFAITPRQVDGTIPLDWRIDHNALRWDVIDVPVDVRARLLALLRRMGLRFAAIDLCIDHRDEWWFIEANPAGQWAWDHPLRDAIAAAIADALTRRATTS